jgi:hypothetical protein
MTTLGDETVAQGLLNTARALVERPGMGTRGLWPRASALLARQSLEVALKTYWSAVAPGAEEASMRAQLLCLERYLSPGVARQAHQVWTALSRASHHHAYELQPTREELLSWIDTVGSVVTQTERAWVK